MASANSRALEGQQHPLRAVTHDWRVPRFFDASGRRIPEPSNTATFVVSSPSGAIVILQQRARSVVHTASCPDPVAHSSPASLSPGDPSLASRSHLRDSKSSTHQNDKSAYRSHVHSHCPPTPVSAQLDPGTWTLVASRHHQQFRLADLDAAARAPTTHPILKE